jgi:capsular exopolysaccharide synthesis family protein
MAEAYRAVRTALYFGAHGASHRILQVTSPNPGDGKSTLSSNLAASIAQSGKRVLLIDADFRRPRAHKLFHITSRVGVSAVIQGAASLEEATHATAVENLWLMPCGARPDNPAELLTSPKFEELLNQVRDQYDWVIVDTPPLLAVTDPCAVAARVDGVIVTIRVGPRSRSAIVRTTEMLENIGANILGVVVNGVGPADNQGEHGYNALTYGYGSKYYQYGQEYYIAGDGDNPNYGYDDSPSQRLKNGKTNGHAGNGTNGLRPNVPPAQASLPGVDANRLGPGAEESSSKNDPPIPKPPSSLQDLLRKHQHPGSPPTDDGA